MPDLNAIREALARIRATFAAMSLAKRAAMMVAAGMTVAVMVFLFQLSSKSNYYEVLFSNMKAEDVGEVASALDKLRVPYQTQSESRSIMVPADQVLETRLRLAEQGLPSSGGVGFEIFDKKTFGMTEFEQRLNYQRALQGELARTINTIEEVEDSRVHLVIPERTIFAQAREIPTASVVLKLKQDKKISEARVQGVVNLVSRSVANLEPKNVTVVDATGQLLTSSEGDGSPVAISKKRNDMERDYEAKIRSLLEPIVGMGKVQVQVTAELDFTSKETTEEKYDPESIAVRSEKRSKLNEANTQGAAGGVVGANPQKNTATGGKDKNEQNETIEYEVSKQIQRIVSPTGELKKISVAVVVDGMMKPDADGNPQYVARTADELKSYEDLVKSAIGYQAERGDQLKVMNLAFQNLDQLFAESSTSLWQNLSSGRDRFVFYLNLLTKVVVALVAVLFMIFVLRPLVAGFAAGRQAAGEGGGTRQLDGKQQLLLQEAQLKSEIQKQALEDPDNMANVLRSWLSS